MASCRHLFSRKESACSAGDAGDLGLIPGSRRSPGKGNGNPLQHSCLENPKDKGAWQVLVYGVEKNRTPLKRLSTHARTFAQDQLPNEMQVICLANVSQINTHLNINLYCSRKERGKQDDFFGDGWERKLQLPGSGWRWCLRGKPTQEQ